VGGGDGLAGKVTVQDFGRAPVNPKKQPGGAGLNA